MLTQVARTPKTDLARMGQAGREWMRTDFSPVAYCNRMTSLYEELGVGAIMAR